MSLFVIVRFYWTCSQSPPVRLYNQLYRKLQQRLRRGTITTEQWNTSIALAGKYKQQALNGEISIFELEEAYNNL